MRSNALRLVLLGGAMAIAGAIIAQNEVRRRYGVLTPLVRFFRDGRLLSWLRAGRRLLGRWA
ncbi:MAG: hypothetical protein IMX05_03375 [Hydrogenibacillus schlegelii]|nr:hypothetical protein [Hydrogenibacillus schlegelii]